MAESQDGGPAFNAPALNEPNVNEPNVNEPNVNEPNVNEPNVNEPNVNEHGAQVTERRIFGWDELVTTRWDNDQVEAQILTGEHMHMIRATYDPGATYEMHSHPHEQFSLLLSGRMSLTVGEDTREIGPGDGWYAPGGVPHGGEVLGDKPAVFIDVYSPATTWILDVFAQGRRTDQAQERPVG